ncbi:MAG: DUF4870 domain-containing protein [Anaerolineae bacterium]|nr:DUF4870 domain-containing protein [Anaerolineae bacterium]
MTKRKTKALETAPLEEEKPAEEAQPVEEAKAVEEVTAVEQKPSALAPKQAPYLGLTRDEMTWAALAHASILVTLAVGLATGGLGAIVGVVLPAIIWYAHRDKSEYVVDQARQATIFQLAGIAGLLVLAVGGAILLTVAWVASALLVLVLVGLVLLPLVLILTLLWVVAIVALPIAQVVYGCYAAVETYNGRPFRYRWFADLIDQYIAKP